MPYTFEKSRHLYERASQHIAGGVNSGIRKLEVPVPLYFDHGRGSRLFDVDGNEYIDYQIGQGAILYGHAPEGLSRAIAEQAAKGTHWAAQSALEIEVADKIASMIPSVDYVRFNNSATEVVAIAHRVARAHTGRPLILRFEGHYHGWLDEGLVGFANPKDHWGPADNPARTHPSQGIIPSVLDHFVVVQWNDVETLRKKVAAHKDQIAGIIFEPILCNTSCIEGSKEMLSTIRELCDQHGIVMIADETITGFRFGQGGAQEYLGFSPDLTILGKAVGGGLPFAAIAGKKPFFEKIIEGKVVHAGTLNSNPLCLAASNWCMDFVKEKGDAHPATVNTLGKKLMKGLRELADRHHIPLRPQGPGAAFHSVMLKEGAEEGPVRNYRDYVERHNGPRFAHLRRMLLEEGVRAIERGLWFVSMAHTEKDIEETLQRSVPAFERHAAEYKA